MDVVARLEEIYEIFHHSKIKTLLIELLRERIANLAETLKTVPENPSIQFALTLSKTKLEKYEG